MIKVRTALFLVLLSVTSTALGAPPVLPSARVSPFVAAWDAIVERHVRRMDPDAAVAAIAYAQHRRNAELFTYGIGDIANLRDTLEEWANDMANGGTKVFFIRSKTEASWVALRLDGFRDDGAETKALGALSRHLRMWLDAGSPIGALSDP